MRLILVCLLCSGLFAQTPTKKPVSACKESKEAAQLREVLAADLERERARNLDLEKAKIVAEAKAAAAEKTLEDMRVAGQQLIDYTKGLQDEYQKNVASYNGLTEKYNSMLQLANQQISTLNSRLARQQQIYNNLAIYSAMPKYTPPPITVLPPTFTPKLSINCTTNTVGSTTFTNCN